MDNLSMKKWNSKHRSNPNKKALSPPNEPCTNLLKSNRPNLLSTDVLKDKSFMAEWNKAQHENWPNNRVT